MAKYPTVRWECPSCGNVVKTQVEGRKAISCINCDEEFAIIVGQDGQPAYAKYHFQKAKAEQAAPAPAPAQASPNSGNDGGTVSPSLKEAADRITADLKH